MNFSSDTNRIMSVIIPIYHGKKYITSLYEMIRVALTKANVFNDSEIIYVNDSPDEPFDDYQLENSVFITNENNFGIHKTKIEGLKAAKGELIHFLDQDDLIDEEFYNKQLSDFDGYDISICNAIVEHETYKRILYRSKLALRMVTTPNAYVYIDNRVESLGQCVIRKDAISNRWTSNLIENNGADDFYLLMLMFIEKKNFRVIEEVLYTHIYTDENLSLDIAKMNESFVSVINKISSIYPNEKLTKLLERKKVYLSGMSKSIHGTILFRAISMVRRLSVRIRG